MHDKNDNVYGAENTDNQLNIYFTKSLAEAFRSRIGVAFDLVLCPVDKVVTFVLEWDPCSSICRTVCGCPRTGQRWETILSPHTMLQQLPLFSSFLIMTAGCLSLFKLFHAALRNKNYKNYFDFTLNVPTQACPPHRWFQDSRFLLKHCKSLPCYWFNIRYIKLTHSNDLVYTFSDIRCSLAAFNVDVTF